MTYRPDIDGLRAIAVLAVILYHAEIPGFGGGYVGVDVFFVISGYLITQLLAGSAEKPLRPRLQDFYLRRARRILPALFATSLVVAVVSAAILLPWDLARLGRYLAATPVFWTNVTAWLEGTGYFSSKLVHVPITHFWSVAIEEQFYLIYPISFALICRYLPRHQGVRSLHSGQSRLPFASGVYTRRPRPITFWRHREHGSCCWEGFSRRAGKAR